MSHSIHTSHASRRGFARSRPSISAQVHGAAANQFLVRSVQALLTAIGALTMLGALSVLVVPTAAFAAADGVASPTLTFASHVERDGDVRLIAGTYLASLRADDGFVPIPVAVAIDGGGPEFTLRPESFTLITADGTEIPAAAFSKVRGDYRKQSFDRRILGLRPFLGGQEFIGMIGVPSNFYPAPDGGVRQATAQMVGNTYTVDLLYFEVPDGALEDVFALRLEADGLGDPVTVRLELP